MAKSKQEVAGNNLLPVNPLLQNQVVISPEEETEQKVQMITEIESLATINEQHIKIKQQQARLEIETRKIGASKKLTEVIDNLIDLGFSEEVLSTVVKNIKTPLDLKLYSEALKNLTDTRNKNADSFMQDESGRRLKTKILAQFRTASGEQATIAAEIPGND